MNRYLRYCKYVCLLGFVVLVLQASCLRELDPSGAPCRDDSDCWSTHFCVKGKCQSSLDAATTPDEPAVQPESRPEPLQEPAPEPRETAPETRPEPRPEPRPEITPEPDVSDQPPPVGRNLYEPCAWYDWSEPKERCLPGLICVRSSAIKANCQRDCSADPKTCDGQSDGRTTCQVVNWSGSTPQRACLKLVNRDQSCDESQGIYCHTNGTQSGLCTGGLCVPTDVKGVNESCNPLAKPPQVCDITQGDVCASNGTCVKSERRFELDPCNAGPCPYGLDCSNPPAGSALRYCIKRCTVDTDCNHWPHPSICESGICLQRGCRGDFDCLFRTRPPSCERNASGYPICRLRNPSSIGPGEFGDICLDDGKKVECKGGLRCLQFNAQKGSCTMHCVGDNECIERDPRYRCIVKVGSGFTDCGIPCTTATDCPNGNICYAKITCGPQ